jgi:hypothetical protein
VPRLGPRKTAAYSTETSASRPDARFSRSSVSARVRRSDRHRARHSGCVATRLRLTGGVTALSQRRAPGFGRRGETRERACSVFVVTRFVVDCETLLRIAAGEIEVAAEHKLLAPTLVRSQALSAHPQAGELQFSARRWARRISQLYGLARGPPVMRLSVD